MRFEELSDSEVMMMPDSVFGRRWWSKVHLSPEIGTLWAMAADSLPERAVIWEAGCHSASSGPANLSVAYRLGQVVAVTTAEFVAMEELFATWRGIGQEEGAVNISQAGGQYRFPMRHPVRTASRRLVVSVTNSGAALVEVDVGILLSSWPSGEVPAYLL